MKKIAVKGSTLRMVTQILRARNVYFIAGLNSVTVPSRQEKWVDVDVARQWPNLDGEPELMCPGEAARTELRRAFPGLKRVGWFRQQMFLLDYRQPVFYSQPWQSEDGVYIDLKSAYWNIYRRLWLDVAFPRGSGTLPLWGVAERLEKWKLARNSVVGMTVARQAVGIKGSRRIPFKTDNPFFTPHLWATVQEILHELAVFACGFGCQYIATDGYLFPDRRGNLFAAFLDTLRLPYRRHAAPIEVLGWGSYSVFGVRETVFYKRGRRGGQPVDNLSVYRLFDPLAFLEWFRDLEE